MLAQLLEKRGIGARIEGTAALSMSNVVPTDGVAMVCLSYLDTTSPAHMRYMIRPRPAQVARCPGSFSAAGWPMGMLRYLRRR
jgi:copper homeostasis protein CutC